jgi:hypothetical protein
MVCKRNLTAAQHLHLAEFPFFGLRKNLTLFGNDIVSWRRVFNYNYDPFFSANPFSIMWFFSITYTNLAHQLKMSHLFQQGYYIKNNPNIFYLFKKSNI